MGSWHQPDGFFTDTAGKILLPNENGSRSEYGNSVLERWQRSSQVDVKLSNGAAGCNTAAARVAGNDSSEEDNAEIISFTASLNPFSGKLTLRLIDTHAEAVEQELDAIFYDLLGRPV